MMPSCQGKADIEGPLERYEVEDQRKGVVGRKELFFSRMELLR